MVYSGVGGFCTILDSVWGGGQSAVEVMVKWPLNSNICWSGKIPRKAAMAERLYIMLKTFFKILYFTIIKTLYRVYIVGCSDLVLFFRFYHMGAFHDLDLLVLRP